MTGHLGVVRFETFQKAAQRGLLFCGEFDTFASHEVKGDLSGSRWLHDPATRFRILLSHGGPPVTVQSVEHPIGYTTLKRAETNMADAATVPWPAFEGSRDTDGMETARQEPV